MTVFDKVMLQTPRLLLRPLEAPDAPALFAIFSDPRVMRYWNTRPWTAIEQAHVVIARDRVAMPAGEHLRLGIERGEDKALIGTCQLYGFNAQCRRAELGYSLAYSAWGQGYMNEALTALLDYSFTELNLHRVEADVDPRNEASARCLERLGFVREGYLRERWIVAGEVSDTAFYGLLRSDWEARE